MSINGILESQPCSNAGPQLLWTGFIKLYLFVMDTFRANFGPTRKRYQLVHLKQEGP